MTPGSVGRWCLVVPLCVSSCPSCQVTDRLHHRDLNRRRHYHRHRPPRCPRRLSNLQPRRSDRRSRCGIGRTAFHLPSRSPYHRSLGIQFRLGPHGRGIRCKLYEPHDFQRESEPACGLCREPVGNKFRASWCLLHPQGWPGYRISAGLLVCGWPGHSWPCIGRTLQL